MSSSDSPAVSAPAPKPWYRSSTVIGLVALALVAAHAHFGWSWLPPDDAAAEHVAEGLVGVVGAVLALRGRAKATQPVSLSLDVGKLLGVTSVLAIALVASGCQALGLKTATDPSASAPASSGIGILVFGNTNSLDRALAAARLDQSGATGASGQASSTAEQSQTTEIGAEAVSALLDAAQAALAGGNPAAAQGILGAAQKIGSAKKEKPSPVSSTSTKEALATAAAATAAKVVGPPTPGAINSSPPTNSPASATTSTAPASGSPPSNGGDATK